ncbi:hypothetical protein PIB30_011360 [Stylosanthes scabra]|uniref:Uncharacterized protein n=1 Tax=Stylosanthes scabra TaxID=79078 RepID=A0ABU6X5H7_9FABA|nr:hypothetical protein [Stylosanthes scabra]
MWMKRKQILKSHIQVAPFGGSSNNSSWEERAFAEDAARILGGCIWPPRSYSCSFCKREFRLQVALQSAESFAVPTGTGMEDLDLELRLGKPQKV